MIERLIQQVRAGGVLDKALFAMLVGMAGVFIVLAVFYGLIYLLRALSSPRRPRRPRSPRGGSPAPGGGV